MNFKTIAADETHCFSKIFLDYLSQEKKINSLYARYPTLKNFGESLTKRNFSIQKREKLIHVLQKQYQNIEIGEAVKLNIEKLASVKTFTITTGHQLNLCTGPLYFIYKIITVINTCKALKRAYPEYNFVPIYWMASEDHDFEEINYFFFEGKKYQWNHHEKGAVGHFETKGMSEIFDDLPKGFEIFKNAYLSHHTLADAVRHYINFLFGNKGLVVLDADDKSLKEELKPIISDDLFAHTAHKIVENTNHLMKEVGYKPQAHIREINFFYLNEKGRNRLIQKNGGFLLDNISTSFTYHQIKKLIQTHPENFSPNVILRPLFQEMILPNLAYIGGPSELIYWLQLKSLFEHYQVPFPILMPRNFALIVKKNILKKWNKSALKIEDVFLEKEKIYKKWVQKNAPFELSYHHQQTEIDKVFKKISELAKQVDKTLVQHVQSIHAQTQKKIAKAEKKLLRVEKKKYMDRKKQIFSVKENLFPQDIPQERHDNFMEFYLKDHHFLDHLFSVFNPFEHKMYVLFE